MLDLDEVRRHYEGPGGVVKAVDGVSLSVAAGEVVAIFGPSGSGKTTLLRIAARLERPDAGTVRFGGTDLSSLSSAQVLAYRRNDLGFIYQDANLIPGLTAEENVSLPLLVRGVGHRHAWFKALSVLGVVGLGDRAGHLPAQLSGGQKQRVAVARALVGEPRLLLADEPTGNLDTKLGAEILSLLSGLARERNVATVLVTHDVRAASYADRVYVLEDGKLVHGEVGHHALQLQLAEVRATPGAAPVGRRPPDLPEPSA